jgi:phage virion morphogenesis protein
VADGITIRVNDQDFRAKLNTFGQRISPQPLLKIVGAYMLGSIDRTFREGGSPANSWKPWAPSTVKRFGKKAAGRKILIGSGRLKNSITYQVQGNTVRIGSNLVYAAIHQMGGRAGRNRAANIPARPYLVFRPEDPANIVEALQTFIDQQAQNVGLK